MSARTVSDGGGTSGPPLVAGNLKKPPDKGVARVDPLGVDGALDVQRTPAGAVKALWTGAKRAVNALASPTKRGESSARAAEPDEEDVLGNMTHSSPVKRPGPKRRKKNSDDVWTGAPLVPEVVMADEVSAHADAEDEEDVFTARPLITPMLAPQAAIVTAAAGAATSEDFDVEEDDMSVKSLCASLAEDIARVRERMTHHTFSSEWVRKELALLVEHGRQLRRTVPEGTRYGFDFDTAVTTPELATTVTRAPDAAIDSRLEKLETSFAKLFEAITGGAVGNILSSQQATSPAPPTSQTVAPDPDSYAARASSAPSAAPALPTSTTKAQGPQTKAGKNSQTRRYEEARAIFQLTTPLRHSERVERSKRIAADTEVVNDALLEHCGASMGPRVAGLSWSENGNLVLMAMDGFKGEHLVEHAMVITTALGIACDVKARRDVPWHKVTLARVPTFGPEGHMLSDEDVRANLRKSNPRFASLALVDSISPVHWLTSEQARRSQSTASMVVCLATQEDADTLLSLNNRIYVFGHTCGTRKFEERSADPICTNCWMVKPKHRTSSCKSEPRCKICAGSHHTDEHTCKSCAEERATSNGDEQMEGADSTFTARPCEHIPLKCVNCGEAHAANDARCPHRRKVVGSSAGAPPMSGLGQPKRPGRKTKRSPATGANATEPVEKPREIGWADPEVWPMTLPYGEEESTTAPESGKRTGNDEPQPTADAPQTQDGTVGEQPKVLSISLQTPNASAPLTGQAKRQARVKLLKEAFPSATDVEWRRWVGSANGDVSEAIRMGTEYYEGNAKTVPGERKMVILRAQWAALDAGPTKTPNASKPEAAAASKTALSNLLNPTSNDESA